jgi:DNA-binding GntR family transcriptional regulator
VTYGDRTRGETTKADGVYLEVRNQILYGVLEPGSRVDYVQLSASLGVSVTPLREALRRLEADHLVIRSAHRDVMIAPLTREEAAELVTVRRELDLLAARLAATQMTPDELAGARALVAGQDDEAALRYLRDAGIPVAVGGMQSINRAFHRMVYCGSHNQVLIQYRDAISTRTERYVILARQISTVAPGAYQRMHERLLTALEARDPVAAVDLMRAHYRELDLDFADVIFGEAPAARDLPGPATFLWAKTFTRPRGDKSSRS